MHMIDLLCIYTFWRWLILLLRLRLWLRFRLRFWLRFLLIQWLRFRCPFLFPFLFRLRLRLRLRLWFRNRDRGLLGWPLGQRGRLLFRRLLEPCLLTADCRADVLVLLWRERMVQ